MTHKPMATMRRIRLRNRRVTVGYCAELGDWSVQFRMLVDRPSREIRRTEFKLSKEAMTALLTCILDIVDWDANSLRAFFEHK